MEGEPFDVMVLGDSWVSFDHCWPCQLSNTHQLKTLIQAEGGSISAALVSQASGLVVARRRIDQHTIAIIHSGGNDIQHQIANSLGGFLIQTVVIVVFCGPLRTRILATFSIVVGVLCAVHAWTLAVFAVMFGMLIFVLAIQCSWGNVVQNILRNLFATLKVMKVLGVKRFLVAGLPVSPHMPLVVHIKEWIAEHEGFFPLNCCSQQTRRDFIEGIVGHFIDFAKIQFELEVKKFVDAEKDCSVIYYDEAATLDSIA